MDTTEKNKQFLFKMGGWLLVVLIVLALAGIISLAKGWRFIGAGLNATNIISVSAEASLDAKPTGGTISFTQRNDAKTAKEAEDLRNVVVAKALAAIKKIGIEDKDINTTSINRSEKYDYNTRPCSGGYCPGTPTVVGYDAYQSVTIKVRDTENLSKVIDALRDAGVTQVDGPQLGFQDEELETLQAQARKEAIKKARAKADVLADQLGVEIVRVVSFSEGGDRGYMPYMAVKAMDSMAGEAAAPSVLPIGDSKISSSVTITYEIK
jgi:uncharacterized protein YggE